MIANMLNDIKFNPIVTKLEVESYTSPLLLLHSLSLLFQKILG